MSVHDANGHGVGSIAFCFALPGVGCLSRPSLVFHSGMPVPRQHHVPAEYDDDGNESYMMNSHK